MDTASISLIVAIIGCISGVTSLLINLYSFLLSKSKMKIEVDHSNKSYLFDAKEFKITGVHTNKCAVISVKVSNCSSYPVTIHEIIVHQKRNVCNHENDFHFTPVRIQMNETLSAYYSPSSSLHLPLRIEAFDTVYGSIRLPFADEMFTKYLSNNKPLSVKLTFLSPRGKNRCFAKLYEYHDLHQIRHNQ